MSPVIYLYILNLSSQLMQSGVIVPRTASFLAIALVVPLLGMRLDVGLEDVSTRSDLMHDTLT